LARSFADHAVAVTIANTRGPESLQTLAADLGPTVTPATVDDALTADVILAAVHFLQMRELGARLRDWAGKVVVDTTNAFLLPNVDEILNGRLSTDINAELFPGADMVKAFNQTPPVNSPARSPQSRENALSSSPATHRPPARPSPTSPTKSASPQSNSAASTKVGSSSKPATHSPYATSTNYPNRTPPPHPSPSGVTREHRPMDRVRSTRAAYLAVGGMKIALSTQQLADNPNLAAVAAELPAPSIKAIGAIEVAGAVGLVLPRLTGIATILTPVAALAAFVAWVASLEWADEQRHC
jgi:hypothetical protein